MRRIDNACSSRQPGALVSSDAERPSPRCSRTDRSGRHGSAGIRSSGGCYQRCRPWFDVSLRTCRPPLAVPDGRSSCCVAKPLRRAAPPACRPASGHQPAASCGLCPCNFRSAKVGLMGCVESDQQWCGVGTLTNMKGRTSVVELRTRVSGLHLHTDHHGLGHHLLGEAPAISSRAVWAMLAASTRKNARSAARVSLRPKPSVPRVR